MAHRRTLPPLRREQAPSSLPGLYRIINLLGCFYLTCSYGFLRITSYIPHCDAYAFEPHWFKSCLKELQALDQSLAQWHYFMQAMEDFTGGQPRAVEAVPARMRHTEQILSPKCN